MTITISSLPSSGYASPQSTSLSAKVPPKPKPVNVFTNDGSFLERFQRSKREEEDRRKAEEALEKKKLFADRFKNRGKRPPPLDSSPAVTSTDLANPTKKPKFDDAPSARDPEYRKDVRRDTINK